ncbi:hypothetical protein PIB30_110643, partial [Stylosanthes scabra]|nr:hypothetical protein [Stylosanthes scabra]
YVHGHVATTLNVTMTHLPTYRRTTSTHMHGRHSAIMQVRVAQTRLQAPKTYAYAWKSTHMRGKLP